jgi:hypothetical protein
MGKAAIAAGPFATLLDTSRNVVERIAATSKLASEDSPAAIEALTRVAQQIGVPAELATAVGTALGQLCFRRECDVHELDLAMFSTEADRAYNIEIDRLLRLSPNVKMRRPD